MNNTLLGHPKGLFVCFLTELWERFAYYGMLSLLILYLTKHFLVSDGEGNQIVAAYGGLVWMLPVVGGIASDRLLGSRKAVCMGALLMALGLLSVSFPWMLAWLFPRGESEQSLQQLFFSLAIVVTGVGFLKTNISTIVGALYALDDPRRDSGFTTFYMGINIGGALGPVICGGLAQVYGMRYGFSAAGFGMLVALATFLYGQRYLEGRADPPHPDRLRQKVLLWFNLEWLVYLGALAMVVVLWQLLQAYQLVSGALLWFAAALGFFILYFSIYRCTPVERGRMLAVASLIAFAIIFWSLYMQMFSSLTLFSDRLVDRNVFGLEIAASQLQALPSIFVISLAPLFSFMWYWLGRRRLNPNIPVKFSLSLMLVGAGFVMPAIGQALNVDSGQISLLWFVMIFLLMVSGELCQAPISMNMITRLCPRRVMGMMMGAYFVSLALGSVIAGELAAKYTQVSQHADGRLVDPMAALDTYTSAFASFGAFAAVVGVALLLVSPRIQRAMNE